MCVSTHNQIEITLFELFHLQVRDTFPWCLDNMPQLRCFHISTNSSSYLTISLQISCDSETAFCMLQSCCPNHCAFPAYLTLYWLAWTNHYQMSREDFTLKKNRALLLSSALCSLIPETGSQLPVYFHWDCSYGAPASQDRVWGRHLVDDLREHSDWSAEVFLFFKEPLLESENTI